MSYFKRYFLRLFYNILEIIFLLFLLTIFYYFNFLSEKQYSFLKLIILLGSIFFNSYSIGKKANKKGYLEGLKYGGGFILISILPNVFLQSFQIKLLLYYLLITTTSILGSMIGSSKKKKNL